MSTEFLFDALLEEQDICNLENEKQKIKSLIKKRQKIIVYGPRNYGKTSLLKNVIQPWFRKEHKNAFIIFVDLMNVKNIESIDHRILQAFEQAFSKTFPAKHLLQMSQKIISHLRPTLEIDPLTSTPSISISIRPTKVPSFVKLLKDVNVRVAKETKCLLIFDEFQDISLIPEAQGLFRQVLQEMNNVSVVMMGSKRHLLAELFASPNAPLANTGVDISFNPIEYTIFHQYMVARFKNKKIEMDLDESIYLQNLMQRVPESINMLCASIKEIYQNEKITLEKIHLALNHLLETRNNRFKFIISQLSLKEEELLFALAQEDFVEKINSAAFSKKISHTPAAITKSIKKFLNSGLVEHVDEGYRLTDPLLKLYLVKNR